MTYSDIIKQSFAQGEDRMWKGIDRVSDFLEKMRDEHPHEVRCFLKDEYIAMNGKHFNEAVAHKVVSEMHHTANGKKIKGEIVSVEDAQSLVADKDEQWRWDAYVAANTMAHDLANTGMSMSQIKESAKHFFFHDEDFSDENKIFWYHEWKLF